jgi:hypothetical protein
MTVHTTEMFDPHPDMERKLNLSRISCQHSTTHFRIFVNMTKKVSRKLNYLPYTTTAPAANFIITWTMSTLFSDLHRQSILPRITAHSSVSRVNSNKVYFHFHVCGEIYCPHIAEHFESVGAE